MKTLVGQCHGEDLRAAWSGFDACFGFGPTGLERDTRRGPQLRMVVQLVQGSNTGDQSWPSPYVVTADDSIQFCLASTCFTTVPCWQNPRESWRSDYKERGIWNICLFLYMFASQNYWTFLEQGCLVRWCPPNVWPFVQGCHLWQTPGVRDLWVEGGDVHPGEVIELCSSPQASEGMIR